jgi:hypothetical protein
MDDERVDKFINALDDRTNKLQTITVTFSTKLKVDIHSSSLKQILHYLENDIDLIVELFDDIIKFKIMKFREIKNKKTNRESYTNEMKVKVVFDHLFNIEIHINKKVVKIKHSTLRKIAEQSEWNKTFCSAIGISYVISSVLKVPKPTPMKFLKNPDSKKKRSSSSAVKNLNSQFQMMNITTQDGEKNSESLKPRITQSISFRKPYSEVLMFGEVVKDSGSPAVFKKESKFIKIMYVHENLKKITNNVECINFKSENNNPLGFKEIEKDIFVRRPNIKKLEKAFIDKSLKSINIENTVVIEFNKSQIKDSFKEARKDFQSSLKKINFKAINPSFTKNGLESLYPSNNPIEFKKSISKALNIIELNNDLSVMPLIRKLNFEPCSKYNINISLTVVGENSNLINFNRSLPGVVSFKEIKHESSMLPLFKKVNFITYTKDFIKKCLEASNRNNNFEEFSKSSSKYLTFREIKKAALYKPALINAYKNKLNNSFDINLVNKKALFKGDKSKALIFKEVNKDSQISQTLLMKIHFQTIPNSINNKINNFKSQNYVSCKKSTAKSLNFKDIKKESSAIGLLKKQNFKINTEELLVRSEYLKLKEGADFTNFNKSIAKVSSFKEVKKESSVIPLLKKIAFEVYTKDFINTNIETKLNNNDKNSYTFNPTLTKTQIFKEVQKDPSAIPLLKKINFNFCTRDFIEASVDFLNVKNRHADFSNSLTNTLIFKEIKKESSILPLVKKLNFVNNTGGFITSLKSLNQEKVEPIIFKKYKNKASMFNDIKKDKQINLTLINTLLSDKQINKFIDNNLSIIGFRISDRQTTGAAMFSEVNKDHQTSPALLRLIDFTTVTKDFINNNAHFFENKNSKTKSFIKINPKFSEFSENDKDCLILPTLSKKPNYKILTESFMERNIISLKTYDKGLINFNRITPKASFFAEIKKDSVSVLNRFKGFIKDNYVHKILKLMNLDMTAVNLKGSGKVTPSQFKEVKNDHNVINKDLNKPLSSILSTNFVNQKLKTMNINNSESRLFDKVNFKVQIFAEIKRDFIPLMSAKQNKTIFKVNAEDFIQFCERRKAKLKPLDNKLRAALLLLRTSCDLQKAKYLPIANVMSNGLPINKLDITFSKLLLSDNANFNNSHYKINIPIVNISFETLNNSNLAAMLNLSSDSLDVNLNQINLLLFEKLKISSFTEFLKTNYLNNKSGNQNVFTNEMQNLNDLFNSLRTDSTSVVNLKEYIKEVNKSLI